MPTADPVLCNQIKKIIHRDDDLGFVICFPADTRLSTQEVINIKYEVQNKHLYSPFCKTLTMFRLGLPSLTVWTALLGALALH